MKNNETNFLHKLFFVACALVTLGGIVCFGMVVVGTIMGGEAGTALIKSAQSNVVPIYEWIMGIGVFIGIINVYITKSHSYKMESKKEKK